MPFLGEFAALFTAFCWSMSAVGFSNATRSLGSQVTNRLRVVLALVLLLVINTILFGAPIPFDAGWERWGWLTLSGIIGLALGDAFLFATYAQIGPRLGVLMLSLAPVFSVFLSWVFYHETLTMLQLIGIGITLGGIGWVVLARRENNGQKDHNMRKGILFGLLASLGQAVGLVLSKQGMAGEFSPFAGTLIRMLAAAISLWLVAALQGKVRATVQTVVSNPSGFRWVAFGAVFGPVLGVSASLLAIQHTAVGIASTIMALPPILMLPISHFFYKEKLSWQAVVGTLVAIGGVALLFI